MIFNCKKIHICIENTLEEICQDVSSHLKTVRLWITLIIFFIYL